MAPTPLDLAALAAAYREQLQEIGRILVEAGLLDQAKVERHGVRFAVVERFTWVCGHCGKSMPVSAGRADMKWCSGACRTAAYRRRAEKLARDAAGDERSLAIVRASEIFPDTAQEPRQYLTVLSQEVS